jgi:hypothetical protein
MSQVTQTARQVSMSRQMRWAARAGLTARGSVYLLIGLLAALVAFGKSAEVDQKGALAEVISRPFGGWLVGLAAVGFACFQRRPLASSDEDATQARGCSPVSGASSTRSLLSRR